MSRKGGNRPFLVRLGRAGVRAKATIPLRARKEEAMLTGVGAISQTRGVRSGPGMTNVLRRQRKTAVSELSLTDASRRSMTFSDIGVSPLMGGPALPAPEVDLRRRPHWAYSRPIALYDQR